MNKTAVEKMHSVTKMIAKAINNLPIKEQAVISLYYHDELTMKEIGTILNLTASRVSQIHTKAIRRLKGRVRVMRGNETILI